jgi:hypothetical protein
MGPWLALVTLHAALIAVRAGDARCPSTRQVRESLGGRLPGFVVPAPSSPAAGVLELKLIESSSEHRFVVVDSRGELRLSRTLPVSRAATTADCEALAETVALIVDRYVQQLAYQDPDALVTAPAQPRSAREAHWELFVGGTWQPASGGPADLAGYEALLGTGRALDEQGRFALEATLGVRGAASHQWGDSSGRLWRFPAELRLLWRGSAGKLRLEAGPLAGIHLLVLASTPGDGSPSSRQPNDTRAIPVVGAMGALRLSLGAHLFARLVAGGAFDVVRYTFRPCQGMPVPDCMLLGGNQSFGTQRIYVKMGIEGGVSFW